MGKPTKKYTKEELFADSKGRSLHIAVNTFMADHMSGLNKKLPPVNHIVSKMHEVMASTDPNDKDHQQLIKDLQVTRMTDLYPGQDHPDPNLYGLFWTAASRRMLGKEGYKDTDDEESNDDMEDCYEIKEGDIEPSDEEEEEDGSDGEESGDPMVVGKDVLAGIGGRGNNKQDTDDDNAKTACPHSKKRKKANSASAATKKKKRGGRKVGQKNYSEDEYDDVLDVIDKFKPTGTAGYQRCSTELAKINYKKGRMWGRNAGAIRSCFDKLVALKAPTGDPYMPRIVMRARLIQEAIKKAETAGEAGLNNDVIPIRGKGLQGTNLVDEETGKMKDGEPKRNKITALVEGLDRLGNANKDAAKDVAKGMESMANILVGTAESSNAATNNVVDEGLARRVADVESKLETVACNVAENSNKLDKVGSKLDDIFYVMMETRSSSSKATSKPAAAAARTPVAVSSSKRPRKVTPPKTTDDSNRMSLRSNDQLKKSVHKEDCGATNR